MSFPHNILFVNGVLEEDRRASPCLEAEKQAGSLRIQKVVSCKALWEPLEILGRTLDLALWYVDCTICRCIWLSKEKVIFRKLQCLVFWNIQCIFLVDELICDILSEFHSPVNHEAAILYSFLLILESLAPCESTTVYEPRENQAFDWCCFTE